MSTSMATTVVLASASMALVYSWWKKTKSEKKANLVGQVTDLYIYPVKSLKGIRINTAFAEVRGFAFDRRWMIVDDNNVFVTQRRFRKLALIQPSIVDVSTLKLEAEGYGEILVPLTVRGTEDTFRTIEIWEKMVEGTVDQGDEVAEWLEKVLGKKGVRLVYMPDTSVRPTNQARAKSFVSFADGYPFLLAGTSSLEELNRRMEEKSDHVPMNRFRPNIVISGPKPFEEDDFMEIQFGESSQVLQFRNVKPCDRCILTTIDQKTAKLGGLQSEPLKTLKTFRNLKGDDDVYFGVNLVMSKHDHSCAPTLSIGDNVYVKSVQDGRKLANS